MKYFVTADPHSFYDEMYNALHEKGFEEGNPHHKLIICGDVFDRGDKSIEMYKYLRGLGDQFIYIRGNHEDLFDDCLFDFDRGYSPEGHHWHNGTVKTLYNLVGRNPEKCSLRDPQTMFAITIKGKEVSDWINSKAIDYYTIGDYVFVHGWIPEGVERVKELKNVDPYDWKQARWSNGMDDWYMGIRIVDKTIVCGHWHCSYGNYRFHSIGTSEFPSKQYPGWEKVFQPFIAPGIIALDACTAYSGICNVIVIEV